MQKLRTTNILPEKSCSEGKLDVKTAHNFCLTGVFPGEGKSRLGYVLKTFGHACVQH